MQPILDYIHRKYFKLVIEKKTALNEEDILWFVRMFDAFGDGLKASFWLTMDFYSLEFWYNSVLFLVAKVNENAGALGYFLRKFFPKMKISHLIFEDEQMERMKKLINGVNLFEFVPILSLAVLRALDLPYLYETIGYDSLRYDYAVTAEHDFAHVFSGFRLAIAVLWPLGAAGLSLIINYKTGRDTIKIKIIPRDGIADKIALFILGQKMLCMMILGIELSMFAEQMTDKDYWKFMCKFY